MIRLECQNNFLKKSFINLLSQKKLIFSIDSKNYFAFIQIKETPNSIDFKIDDISINFKLPISINNFQKKIYEKLLDINIDFSSGSYFPYQGLIKNKENKNTYLSYLQNIILSNLIVNKSGIEKFILYKLIWPDDKNISINKLDTHLTNLKTHINLNLNININFQSQNKILKLIID